MPGGLSNGRGGDARKRARLSSNLRCCQLLVESSMLKVFLISLIVIGYAQNLAAKEWRGLVPMRSTRADVERILGKPSDPRMGVTRSYSLHDGRSIYFSDYGEAYIVFAKMQEVMGHRSCLESVAADTVLMIQVTPIIEQSVNQFISDTKNFRTFDPSEPPGIGYLGYVDEEGGFVLQTFKGIVRKLVYLPSRNDQQPCAGYYLNPEEFVSVMVHPPLNRKFDEYGDLPFSDEKARLDNFAIQLQSQTGARGFVIVYAGQQAMIGEAKIRATRVKDYLVKIRALKPETVVAIDGGYRKSFLVQLFIVDQDVEPPTPTPTLDASQVEIIPVRKTRSRKRPR